MLEELLAEIPESVLAILRVPGLGPKRAAQLYHELKVATLDDLRAACESHKVQELKGFGAKIEAAILQGLGIAAEAERRMLWIEADQHVQEILAHMRGCKAVQQIAAAGSYRRGRETVGDLDFLVVARNVDAVMDHLAAFGGVASIIARGDTKMSLRLHAGVQVDLRAVPAESFGAALQYFTGSKEHNIVLRGRAKSRGLKINEYGVFRGEKQIAGRTEEDVYGTLDLPCFPPELREARREFDWADAGSCPSWSSRATSAATCTCTARGPTARRRSRKWPPPPRARTEIHRHHRPLEAGDDGPRAGRPPAAAAMGRNRQAQRAA